MLPYIPVFGSTSLASGGYLNIQPTTGQVYQVTNMWSNKAFNIYINSSGTNVLADTNTSGDYYQQQKHLVNNANYLRIYNASTETAIVGYAGIRIY